MREFEEYLKQRRKILIRRGIPVPELVYVSEDGLFRFSKMLEEVYNLIDFDDFYGKMHERFYKEFVEERDKKAREIPLYPEEEVESIESFEPDTSSETTKEEGMNDFLSMIEAVGEVSNGVEDEEAPVEWGIDEDEEDLDAPSYSGFDDEEEELDSPQEWDYEDEEDLDAPHWNYDEEESLYEPQEWDYEDEDLDAPPSSGFEDEEEELETPKENPYKAYMNRGISEESEPKENPYKAYLNKSIPEESKRENPYKAYLQTDAPQEYKRDTNEEVFDIPDKLIEEVKEEPPKVDLPESVLRSNQTVDLIGSLFGGNKKKKRRKQ